MYYVLFLFVMKSDITAKGMKDEKKICDHKAFLNLTFGCKATFYFDMIAYY